MPIDRQRQRCTQSGVFLQVTVSDTVGGRASTPEISPVYCAPCAVTETVDEMRLNRIDGVLLAFVTPEIIAVVRVNGRGAGEFQSDPTQRLGSTDLGFHRPAVGTDVQPFIAVVLAEGCRYLQRGAKNESLAVVFGIPPGSGPGRRTG